MENGKKIPWWVSSSRRGLHKDINMVILGLVFWVIAGWCFAMYAQNNRIESIIYGIVIVVVGIKFIGSYLWLRKNNELER